jgi:hypothetical protein
MDTHATAPIQVPVNRLVGLSQVGFSRRRDKIMPDRTKEKP